MYCEVLLGVPLDFRWWELGGWERRQLLAFKAVEEVLPQHLLIEINRPEILSESCMVSKSYEK